MSRKTLKYFVFLFLLLIILTSCQAVKPYQRAYLNDRDMVFGSTSVEMVEVKTHAYREGAAGAAKGKTSGGCGCR
jgi:hypothetical protein